MNSFNTNINDYTIDELLSLLGLKTPTNNEINEKIYYLTEDRFKNNNNIRSFFYNVQNKLLNNNQNENNYIQNNILPKYDFYENFENLQRNKHNINEEYTNEEYTNDEYTNKEDTNEEDTNEEDINEEDTNEEDTNEENIINNDKKILDINDINGNYNIDKNINFKTEFIYIIKNLYFNTLFRENSLDSYNTNSNFLLSESINNITELRLSEISFKKPFLISKSKSNNKFIIKKYDTSLNDVSFEFPIILDDGYYENISSIENEINNKLKNFDTNNIQSYSSVDSNDLSFIRNLNFSINPNNLRTKFELSYNELQDISFHRFELDFKSYYTPYYSLAYILGFNKNEKKYDSSYISNNDIILTESSNNYIMSPYTFKNNDNNDVFFCLDEHIVNTQENHALFYNKNIISNKILAKVSTNNVDKNNIINIEYKMNNQENTVRKYEGPINLLNFNIKLIDYYGNLINTNDNENITFGLRLKIKSKRII